MIICRVLHDFGFDRSQIKSSKFDFKYNISKNYFTSDLSNFKIAFYGISNESYYQVSLYCDNECMIRLNYNFRIEKDVLSNYRYIDFRDFKPTVNLKLLKEKKYSIDDLAIIVLSFLKRAYTKTSNVKALTKPNI